MKHLLTGVAVVAALAFAAPVWAQPVSPGGNAMGMPGPNPGGAGLTPYTTGPGPKPSGSNYIPPSTRRQGDAIDRHQCQPAQPGRAGAPAVG